MIIRLGANVLTGEKDNTNSRHLELYTILGEYDNAGFPLSYCVADDFGYVCLDKGKVS